jgi:hypothetical protein
MCGVETSRFINNLTVGFPGVLPIRNAVPLIQTREGQGVIICMLQILLHFMICHSKNAIDPAPQDVIKTTRWNNIRDAIGMHKM